MAAAENGFQRSDSFGRQGFAGDAQGRCGYGQRPEPCGGGGTAEERPFRLAFSGGLFLNGRRKRKRSRNRFRFLFSEGKKPKEHSSGSCVFEIRRAKNNSCPRRSGPETIRINSTSRFFKLSSPIPESVRSSSGSIPSGSIAGRFRIPVAGMPSFPRFFPECIRKGVDRIHNGRPLFCLFRQCYQAFTLMMHFLMGPSPTIGACPSSGKKMVNSPSVRLK